MRKLKYKIESMALKLVPIGLILIILIAVAAIFIGSYALHLAVK